jgi:hypothetical protein
LQLLSVGIITLRALLRALDELLRLHLSGDLSRFDSALAKKARRTLIEPTFSLKY